MHPPEADREGWPTAKPGDGVGNKKVPKNHFLFLVGFKSSFLNNKKIRVQLRRPARRQKGSGEDGTFVRICGNSWSFL